MAKKKTEPEIRKAIDIADDVAEVRGQMAELKKEDTMLTALLKEALHTEQKKEAGNYQLSTVVTLKVSDEKLAMPWATEKGAIKIDTAKVREILRHTFDDPSKYGFAKVESERIVPKGGSLEYNE